MAKKNPSKRPAASSKFEEPMTGTTVFNVPLPADLKALKGTSPIVVKQPYNIEYLHSYGQDSPFFAGLSNKKLLGTKCPKCDYTWATPRLACTQCGG
ncbi:MAG: Zn-ribbon domain-containing OB-fold protein, partial [Desulfobacteria bacterium]